MRPERAPHLSDLRFDSACLEFCVGLEHDVADARRCRRSAARARKAAARHSRSTDARGKSRPAAAGSAFPHAEANELQPGKNAVGEVFTGGLLSRAHKAKEVRYSLAMLLKETASRLK